MCEACNEAIKEVFQPTAQQKHRRIYEKATMYLQPTIADVPDDIIQNKRKADRDALIAKGIGALAGAGLGFAAGGQIGKAIAGKSQYAQGYGTGYGGVTGGFLGAALGSRAATNIAGSLNRPAYQDYAYAIAQDKKRRG